MGVEIGISVEYFVRFCVVPQGHWVVFTVWPVHRLVSGTAPPSMPPTGCDHGTSWCSNCSPQCMWQWPEPQKQVVSVSRLRDEQAGSPCIFCVAVLIFLSGVEGQNGWWVEVFLVASSRENLLHQWCSPGEQAWYGGEGKGGSGRKCVSVEELFLRNGVCVCVCEKNEQKWRNEWGWANEKNFQHGLFWKFYW